MQFRHELKQEITYSDMLVIKSRLKAVAKPDPYAENGRYFIRSLYFDTLTDKALREKLDGINVREKFRLRYYNGDTEFIKLEKKSKINGLCQKTSAAITADEVQKILNGDIGFLLESKNELKKELYSKMQCGLAPKTIVDYQREPFVFSAGNVRVTFDYNIRTGLLNTDFLNPQSVTFPSSEAIIMEVKFDNFLPDIIRDIVSGENRRSMAFSKYAVCRIYG